jgi:hypothetical protein
MNSKIYDRFNILVYCACNDIRTMAIPCYQEVLIVVFDSIPKLPTNVIQSQLLEWIEVLPHKNLSHFNLPRCR